MNAERLVVMAFATILGFGEQAARADNDFMVYSPHVVQGQSEVEAYGFYFQDGRTNLNGTSGYNISVGHAVNSWWKPELYVGEFNRNPGSTTYLSGYEFENTFQLTDTGEYWADLGFLASYVYTKQAGQPDRAEFGPLLEKIWGHVDQRLNLIWEKQIGSGASGQYMFRSAYSVSYKIDLNRASISPGMEAYYRPVDNASQAGPVLYGELHLDPKSELEYSLGVVFGINSGAPARTLLARLEYEFF
jgi:hypothetical protein